MIACYLRFLVLVKGILHHNESLGQAILEIEHQ